MHRSKPLSLAITLLLLPLLAVVMVREGKSLGETEPPAAQQEETQAIIPPVGELFQSAPNAPVINVWYGATQTFGQNGDKQKWINILGNASGTSPVTQLTYSLNGGPAQPLNMGPDNYRLALKGDFNVELDYTRLLLGDNLLTITAQDNLGQVTTATVVVKYQGGNNSWAKQTYTFNWQGAATPQSVGQVVDGLWAIQGDLLRPLVFDYDRLVSLGDMTWSDYVVSVPITIYAIDDSGYTGPSNGPGVGILTRWMGHYDVGKLPRTGWERLGGLGWYKWNNNPQRTTSLRLTGGGGMALASKDRTLNFGVTYIFKVSVETTAAPTATYRLKVWEAGQPEPASWDLVAAGTPAEMKSGSILLVAHHVDATFGPVTVELKNTVPLPTLTTVASGTGAGAIQANPQKASYLFGEDVQLSGAPNGGSVFGGWLGDLTGKLNPGTISMFGNKKVTGVFANSTKQAPASDDFSSCALDNKLWTYIDPIGVSALTMTGTQAQISIPAGVAHNLWTGNQFSPRLMQYAKNENFQVEAKFDSAVTKRTQMQGILVEESSNNLIRFTLQHDGSSLRAVVAVIVNETATTRVDQVISGAPPQYMRVQRAGDTWTMYYSNDGSVWKQAVTFDHSMIVTAVGPFVGTAGTAPAFLGQVDYFFNTASPINPEDGGGAITLNVNTQGQGQVLTSPNKPSYVCGEQVTLTAVPSAGWKFEGWSGDLTGSNATETLTMNRSASVTATFVPDTQYTLTVNAVGNGVVNKLPNKPTYGTGEVVQLTAVGDLGYQFTGWSGDLTGATNPVNVTIVKDTTITATFTEAPTSTLSVQVVGEGSVDVSPQKDSYLYGEVVTLTPIPAQGYEFSGWSGDLSGNNNPAQVTMTGNKVVTATFVPAEYDLNVTVVGEGSVARSPNKAGYLYGETVQLTATPASNWTFESWSGGATGNTNPITLTITGDTAITATFAPPPSYEVTVNIVGDGSVNIQPPKDAYLFGEVITLTATAGPDYSFVSWTGDVESTNNPLTLTVTGDTVLTATFGLDQQYTLDVSTVGQGTVTVAPQRERYAEGELVTLTAAPSLGHRFIGWSGDAGGSTNPLTIAMNGNKAIVATFQEATTYTLNVDVDGLGEVAVTPDKAAYESGEVVELRATALPGYLFSGWRGDLTGNDNPIQIVMDGNKSVTATFTNFDGVTSDDFSSCRPAAFWEYISPDDDASWEINGTQLLLTVPGGRSHNIWQLNHSVRYMQPSANIDFELEAKFDTPLSRRYQMQGILIEEDEDNFMRVDFFHDGSSLRLFVGTTIDNKPLVRRNQVINVSGAQMLRVQRTGNRWRVSYFDPAANQWVATSSFRHTINVSSVGVFAGNQHETESLAPGFTAAVDYFFRTDQPIDPEDGNAPAVRVQVTGQGTVSRNPDKAAYSCGEQVALTATPANGWAFSRWEGDVTGSNPNVTLTVNGRMSARAIFVEQPGDSRLYLPTILNR